MKKVKSKITNKKAQKTKELKNTLKSITKSEDFKNIKSLISTINDSEIKTNQQRRESIAKIYLCKFRTYMTLVTQKYLTALAEDENNGGKKIKKKKIQAPNDIHCYHLMFLDKCHLSDVFYQFNKKLMTKFIGKPNEITLYLSIHLIFFLFLRYLINFYNQTMILHRSLFFDRRTQLFHSV